MAKGSSFERQISRELSLWWSDGKDDDIFWRSDSSGGRAKFRGRKGKTTFGAHGDIIARNPIGLPLIELITIEAKDGYKNVSIMSLLEADNRCNPEKNPWTVWYKQVTEAQEQADTPFWMIIHHRKGKKATVTIPIGLYARLEVCWVAPWARFRVMVSENKTTTVFVTTFENWKEVVTPKLIKRMHKEHKNG